ncbi:MAG: polysaccharide biosynthesis tyrosine autokinase [Endomicrobia bacterium]|nr:polysaccharide biosynthesis tyrosine autokinase [Endomicrobiia bacterium]
MADNDKPLQANDLDFIYYFHIVTKRLWLVLAIIVFFIFGSLVISFTTQPVYKACVLLMIDRENTARVDYYNPQSSWNSDEDYYRTQYKLLESRTILESVYKQLNLSQYDEFRPVGRVTGIEKLRNRINVVPVPRSRLLNLEVSSVDPKLAAKIANTMADLYVAGNISNRVIIAQDVLKALNESDSKSTQKDRDILNSMPQVVNNELIKKYKAEQTELEIQKAKLAGKYTDQHPDIIALQKQINTIKAKIDDETQKILQSVKIDLSGQFLGNNIRIVDRAIEPVKPYKPNKRLNLIIGFLAGCLVSFCIAFIMELFDTTIKNSEELEVKLKMPFLGMSHIEKLSKNKTEYSTMLEKGNFLSSESIRNIRTMIGFALSNIKDRSLLIASSIQGEGKSYLSCNLAVAMAQTGEKVLLIDGDLRRSRLHKIFKISNEKGLSNILAVDDAENIDKTANSAVVKSDVNGLFLLPSGPNPPNPAELLNTPKLKAFIHWAEKNFDRVIIDCPAVLPITDTLLWGKFVSNAVFAVKTASTNAKLAKTAIDNLKTAGINILGVVLTMYENKGFKYNKYYYYYNENSKKSH